MDSSFFDMLDETTKDLSNKIESQTGANIVIEVDESRDEKLACEVETGSIRIITPNANYFPSAPVYHELLHIHRFCIEEVPQIAVCDAYNNWTPELEKSLSELDNDIEHFIIVPEECDMYKARRDHWILKIIHLVEKINNLDLSNCEIEQKAMIWWAFAKHALQDDDLTQTSSSLIKELSLEEKAASFLTEIENNISNKDKLVAVFFNYLGLSRKAGCLEYKHCNNILNHQEPIPDI
jgi:hypothetical protein